MMLQFGKVRAKDLITGAAYTYKKYVQGPNVSAPLAAFSDIHDAPAQRARNCKREYEQVAFAFNESIRPHLEERLEKQVLDKTWLPEVKEPPVPEDNSQAGSRALQ
jgi:hypothetical protein